MIFSGYALELSYRTIEGGMFTKKTIKDIDISGKTVLLRADYNVPIKDGEVASDYRITKSLPTIQYLLEKNCKIVICSHLGRPKGETVSKYSLKPVAKELSKLVKKDVTFVSDCVGDAVKETTSSMKPGDIVLLENLRFHAEEESNDVDFAEDLAIDTHAEVFVQDGFGVVHRAHASTDAVTKHLPSVAGMLLSDEVDTITDAIESPDKPLMAIIGGAKIADKLQILKRFISTADYVVVGGAMANTFLKSQGIEVGESLYDKEELDTARDIIELAREENKKRGLIFYLPQDAVVSEDITSDTTLRIVDWDTHSVADIESYPATPKKTSYSVHAHEKILDIGPFSSAFIVGLMQSAKTVIWNGTVGVAEVPALHGPVGPFGHGSEAILHAMAGRYGTKPFSVIGGGDTAGFVESRDLVDMFNHVSTGGGASLDLMSGEKLPGVEALQDKEGEN